MMQLRIFLIILSYLISSTPLISYAYGPPKSPITNSEKYAGFVIDSSTNEIIYAKNAHMIRHPASLTKLMTLYLTFEALDNHKLTMNKKLHVSQKAYKTPYSPLGAKPGEKVTVRDCINGSIIFSANDSSVILAENIAGSEEKFARLMSKKAKQLGMHNTNFTNAHGLHDPNQYTTAYDMAQLALALKRDFPQYYSLFSKNSFQFRGKILTGHNYVNTKYEGAEGLKTGFVNASGYNLVTAAKKPYGHLVGVVLGGETAKERDDHMIDLLDFGFCRLSDKKGYHDPKCSKKFGREPQHIFAVIDDKKSTRLAQLTNKRHNTSGSKSSAQKPSKSYKSPSTNSRKRNTSRKL